MDDGWRGPMTVKEAAWLVERSPKAVYDAISKGTLVAGHEVRSERTGYQHEVWLRSIVLPVDLVDCLRGLMDYITEYISAPGVRELMRHLAWQEGATRYRLTRLERRGFVVNVGGRWQPLKNEHGQDVTPVLTWEVAS